MLIRQKLNIWLKSFSGVSGKAETPVVDKQEVEIAKEPASTPNVSWYRSILDKCRF